MANHTVSCKNADEPLWAAVRDTALWEGRSFSSVVTEALKFWLDAHGATERIQRMFTPDDKVMSEEILLESMRETRVRLATEWLQGYLADGEPVPSAQAKRDAEAAGFHERLIGRAREKARVRITPIPGTRGRTFWSIPAARPN